MSSIKKVFKDDLIRILDIYYQEYKEFSEVLARKFHRDNQIYKRGAFSDLEGLLLYALIREDKPDLVFEISPDTGMSTNYILQAIKQNKKGKVIGFELDAFKHNNQPTLDVIKRNQVDPILVDKYYELVIGDATKTCRVSKYGSPDIVLIDSCHDEWFCEWYINNLLPEIQSYCLIQDILYEHKNEGSTEANRLIKYLNSEIPFFIVDKFRDWLLMKNDYFPVRNLLCNSILIAGDKNTLVSNDNIINDNIFDSLVKNPKKETLSSFKGFLINNSFPGGFSQFAPRYIAYCIALEQDKYLSSWLSDLFIGSLYLSRTRYKDIGQSITHLLICRKVNLKIILVIFRIFYNFPISFVLSIIKIFKDKMFRFI